MKQPSAKKDGSATRDVELGEPAQPLTPAADSGGGTPSAAASTAGPQGGGSVPATSTPGAVQAGGTTEPGGVAPSTSPGGQSPPAFHPLGRVDDGKGDHGLEGAAYADILSVVLEENGTHFRARVTVAADLPSALAAGEVEGVGIDLTLGGVDYQLFADGGESGWRAYLYTPQGFIDYPGAFRLGGPQLEFEVPWPALGGRRAGRSSSFIDWSKRRVAINASSNDHAPNSGTAAFTL